MKKLMTNYAPWIAVLFVLTTLLASLKPPRSMEGYDLALAGRLPVLSGGRVTPLDTIARSALLIIRGKQTVDQGRRRLIAIEWLWDVMARPQTADGYKIFTIYNPDVLGLMGLEQKEKSFSFNDLKPFLDAIDSQSQQAASIEPAQRSGYQNAVINLAERLHAYRQLQNTLEVAGGNNFSGEIEAYRQTIQKSMAAPLAGKKSKKRGKKTIAELNQFMERYSFLNDAAYFHSLPTPERNAEEGWRTMGQGLLAVMQTNELHPAISRYGAILDAYRARDPMAFNRAAAQYDAWLRQNFPKTASRAKYEFHFNHIAPFLQGITLYLLAFLLVFLSWLLKSEKILKAAFLLLAAAFIIHTFGLFSRVVLQGRPPVTNLYSSAVFVGWVAVFLGIILERYWRIGVSLAVSSALGLITLIIAHHLAASGDTMEMMRAVLDSNFWLSTHVITITIGYGATFLAGALGHAYILQGVFTKSLTKKTATSLYKMAYGVICFSLFFSFVGTILGGIWADYSWGRFWGWDPKENGALLIVLWNALILHARWAGLARERGVMIMAVFGNIITSLSWFGVNMLGIGLHSYGFMDKAFLWLAAFVVTQLAVMAIASLPPERWKSRPH
ncbi:MAG: cytochrome c biogenesis protein CcsA [Elusimicrobiota bacterium]